MGEGSVIEIASSVEAVCNLEWVLGGWDDGVYVSHYQPFMATDLTVMR